MNSFLWRTIADFPNYEVSNTGLVRNRIKLRLIRPRMLRNGYYQLGIARDGRQWFRMVHRLVAAAFIGILPDGMEVNHKDGNKLNNHVTNLEYVTHRQNMEHAMNVLGNPGGKLTRKEALEIRHKIAQGQKHTDVAVQYGISKGTVRDIEKNRLWHDSNHVYTDGRRKLTAEDVLTIKQRLSKGEKRSLLAAQYAVSTSSIDNIANNKTWNHVKG